MCTSSDCNSCKRASVFCRSVKSRMKPVKKRCSPDLHFADRQLHRKGRAVLALADHDAADADNTALAGILVALHIAVVVVAIGCRHQDLDVLSECLACLVTKQPLGRAAERLHDAAVVDDDHSLGHGVENRLQMRLARESLSRHQDGAPASAVQQLAAPGHPDADHGECETVHHGQGRNGRCASEHEIGGDDTECGRQQAGSETAHSGRYQDGRHEIKEQRVVMEDRHQQGAYRQRQDDGGRRQPVAQHLAALAWRKFH